jgi:(4S)-4-hydroxy-5-phosphonooxypentane-2,3-dione isomerase
MHVLVVDFRIRAEFIESFDQALAANARDSRETEPGCRQFDVCRDPADPSLFFLYELYDDAAAVEAHLASAHFKVFAAETAPWVESKAVRNLVRTSP